MPPRTGTNASTRSRPTLMEEVGRTGLKTSGGHVTEEFLRQLQGEKAVKVYGEMGENDPVVGAMLFSVDNLLRQLEWRVEPAAIEDEFTAENDAEFIRGCKDDMSHTWEDFISECLSMLQYGWSMHEIVYKRRMGETDDADTNSKFDDGLLGWRKFPIRAQETLHRWEFDEEDGGVTGMWQVGKGGVPAFIPLEKALLFRTRIHKDNPEGRSILRNAYRPWFIKKNIEEIEAIGIERDLAGLPVIYLPADMMNEDASEEDKAIVQSFKEMAVNIRRDEQEAVLMPLAWDDESGQQLYRLELLNSGGSRQFDIDSTLERYNRLITMTILADFILLGHEQVGSYALSTSKVGIFRNALAAWTQGIAAILNRYAIPKLMRLNGMMREDYPKIVPGEIDPPSIEELARSIQLLSASGMTGLPMDPQVENKMRELLRMPLLEDSQEATVEARSRPAQQQGQVDDEEQLGDRPNVRPEDNPRG